MRYKVTMLVLLIGAAVLQAACPFPNQGTLVPARSGSVVLRVIREDGTPLNGATVAFAQTSHDFLFGYSDLGGAWGSGPPELHQRLREAGLNYFLCPLTWTATEPESGSYDFSHLQEYCSPDSLHGIGISIDAHELLTLSANSWDVPDYLRSVGFEELRQRTRQHVFDVVGQYKSAIDYWEIGEPVFANAFNLTEDEWVELVDTAVDAAKAADPTARIEILLWPTDLSQDTYHYMWPNAPAGMRYSPHELLDKLIRNGVDFDVIALELYPIGDWVELDQQGYPSVSWFSDVLDSYASFGKPVFLQEIGIPDSPAGVRSDWKCCSGASPEAQARWLGDFYTMAFQKPFVHSLGWFFAIDGNPFLPGAGLLRQDMTEKPSFVVLKDSIASWTSRGISVTDSNGVVQITGYAGDYVVAISDGIHSALLPVQVHEGGEEQTTVTLPST